MDRDHKLHLFVGTEKIIYTCEVSWSTGKHTDLMSIQSDVQMLLLIRDSAY